MSDPSHKSTVITVGYCAKNDLTQCEFGQGAASQGLSFPICRMEVWHNQSQIPPSPNLQFVKLFWASLMAQRLKCLPAMQETWVRSLGWEDPLEGNGNPLQYSCLENPMDRGAWWATVYRVAKSRT